MRYTTIAAKEWRRPYPGYFFTHKLPFGEVLHGLVNMVEDMEFLRIAVPHDVFAASGAVVEEDEELCALFRLCLQLFHGGYSGRHRYHLALSFSRKGRSGTSALPKPKNLTYPPAK